MIIRCHPRSRPDLLIWWWWTDCNTLPSFWEKNNEAWEEPFDDHTQGVCDSVSSCSDSLMISDDVRMMMMSGDDEMMMTRMMCLCDFVLRVQLNCVYMWQWRKSWWCVVRLCLGSLRQSDEAEVGFSVGNRLLQANFYFLSSFQAIAMCCLQFWVFTAIKV